jgi:hypothetical protein
LNQVALDPQANTWQTLLKALIVVEHLVKTGAERCVDHTWQILRRIESLAVYNSALVQSSFGTRGGRDNGAPVRSRAGPFVDFLNDPSAIRASRTASQVGAVDLAARGAFSTKASQGQGCLCAAPAFELGKLGL